jgi:hypothetical protein
MIVVDLDEVLELARRTVEMESKVEVLGWLLLFLSHYWRSVISKFVSENTHDLFIRTLWTDEEEIVGFACSSL